MADKKAAAGLALKERSRGKRFKLPEGDTTFRVLPNAADVSAAEFVEYGMHSEVGPRKAFLRCGKSKSGKGSCWLCDEMIPKLQASGKATHTQVAERMQRKDIFAIQIAYLDPATDKWIGPVLWETPNRVSQDLLNIMQRRDISNPEKGYNLTISRTGTQMKDTRYAPVDRDDEPSEVDEAVMAKLKPFKEVVRKYDEAATKSAYFGHDQEDEPVAVEEEVEEAPSPVKKKSAPVADSDFEAEPEEAPASKVVGKKKPAPVVEDEEVDAELAALEEFENDVPNLEEEVETPQPKGKKKPAPVVEEEPEEEAPKPVGKKKPKPVTVDDDDF